MKNMRIRTITVGMCATNCYLVYHKDTKEALIIDPGDQAKQISDQCKRLELIPKAILLTHGHFDHILAVSEIKEEFHIPVYVGVKEEAVLADPSINMSGMWGKAIKLKADYLVKEKERLELAGFQVEVMETPGHTEGGVCYYIPEEEVLLSGDTLFCNSFGRTDFPTGSMSKLTHSIREKLFVLPENTQVFPGHENSTTIGYERKYNPLA